MLISRNLYTIFWMGFFNPLGEKLNSAQWTRNTIVKDQLWRFNWER